MNHDCGCDNLAIAQHLPSLWHGVHALLRRHVPGQLGTIKVSQPCQGTRQPLYHILLCLIHREESAASSAFGQLNQFDHVKCTCVQRICLALVISHRADLDLQTMGFQMRLTCETTSEGSHDLCEIKTQVSIARAKQCKHPNLDQSWLSTEPSARQWTSPLNQVRS